MRRDYHWRRLPMALFAVFALRAADVRAEPSTRLGPDASASSSLMCEYGITMAQIGRVASAESVFVSMLSQGSQDPRAIANLGNLCVLRGQTDVALAFYEWALLRDSTDAGVALNCATTLMMMGRRAEALRAARDAERQAGGRTAADALLGLGAIRRNAPAAWLSRAEVAALLEEADRGTSSRGTIPSRPVPVPQEGLRGAAAAEAASVLYWKH